MEEHNISNNILCRKDFISDERKRTPEQSPQKNADKSISLNPTKLFLVAVLILFGFFTFGGNFSDTSKEVVVEETPLENPFDGVVIIGKAGFVLDTISGEVLFSKNEEAQLPLASLTKIMTAFVASNAVSKNAVVTIGKDAIDVEGDNGFREGERWRFKQLLDYTLVVSSNDGARAIASASSAFPKQTFIESMNKTAKDLELTQTYFINESGLDSSESVGGGYGSAKDIASLFSYMLSYDPNLLEATAYETLRFVSEDKYLYHATNTNPSTANIPGLLASKTGFTDLAGGNLVVAFDAGINHPIIAVVLGSSLEGRFSDVKKLVSASIRKIALTNK